MANLTPFQEWALRNRDHLKAVHSLSVRRQTEHELNCSVCRAGLDIAIRCCTTLELAEAMDTSRRLVTALTSRRIEGRRRIALAAIPTPNIVIPRPHSAYEGIGFSLIYRQPNPISGLVDLPQPVDPSETEDA